MTKEQLLKRAARARDLARSASTADKKLAYEAEHDALMDMVEEIERQNELDAFHDEDTY